MTCGWLISCRKRCLGTSKPDVWCTSVLERGHLQHSKVVEIKFHLNVGNFFYLFSCACHAVLKSQMHVKSMVVPSIKKVLISYCRGNPVRVFSICSDTLSPHSWKLGGYSLSKPVFRESGCGISQEFCLREEGIYIRRNFFAYFKILKPGESRNSGVHGSPGISSQSV